MAWPAERFLILFFQSYIISAKLLKRNNLICSHGKSVFCRMQNWPEDFLERMRLELKDEFPIFIEALSSPAPISIRMNPWKQGEIPNGAEKIAWSEQGYYLSERPAFIFDPLFHAGTYYVQEASSMFLEHVYKQVIGDVPPETILDLCAAPGGKSTHLLSLLPKESLLISNEIIPKRNAILRQNLVKWGVDNVFVTQNNPVDFEKLGSFFDMVVVDAPCSGEGLFRRDPEAAEHWSEEAVQTCMYRQKEILQNAMAVLKRGGVLIYSTCTFERVEDEDQIRELIDSGAAEIVPIEADFEGILKTNNGFRFYPHRVKGEGFFIAVLRKTGNDVHTKKVKKTFSLQHVPKTLEEYFLDASGSRISMMEERIYAIPKIFVDSFLYLSEILFIRQAGIFIGSVKGKDFIPSHDFALSNHIRKEGRMIELDKEQALLFLKGEPVRTGSSEKGWHLVCFREFPLGWVKVLEGRVNNYLPKEWRINKDLPFE